MGLEKLNTKYLKERGSCVVVCHHSQRQRRLFCQKVSTSAPARGQAHRITHTPFPGTRRAQHRESITHQKNQKKQQRRPIFCDVKRVLRNNFTWGLAQ